MLHRIVFGALLALLIAALWCVPYVATHDGPNHLANCVLANRLAEEGSSLHNYLELGMPVTNLGFQTICESAESLFGWRAGFRVTLTLIALVWVFGWAFLARAVLGERSPVALFGFATALPWAFYMGFFDFLLAEALMFFFLGWLSRREELSLARWGMLSLFLLVIALVHTFVAAFAGVALGVIFLSRRTGWRPLLWLAAASLPAAAIAFLGRPIDEIGTTLNHSAAERLADLAGTFVGGPFYRSWPPVLIALGALILGRWVEAKQRAFLILAALSFAIFIVAPFHVGNWAYFSPRFLLLGLPLALLAAPDLPKPAYLLFAALGAISPIWSIAHHLELEPVVGEVLAGAEAPLKRTGPRLPLMLSRAGDQTGMEEAEPLIMALHLFLFDQGGVDPYLFADIPSRDRILFKDDPKKLFGYFPVRFLKNDLAGAGVRTPPLEVQYEWFAVFARDFEDTIIFADDAAVFDTFARRGYVTDYQSPHLRILRPSTCKLTVMIPQAPVRFRLGHTKLDTPMIDRPVLQAGTLPIEGHDCGPLWVELLGENNLHCKVEFEVAPDHPTEVTCVPARP